MRIVGAAVAHHRPVDTLLVHVDAQEVDLGTICRNDTHWDLLRWV